MKIKSKMLDDWIILEKIWVATIKSVQIITFTTEMYFKINKLSYIPVKKNWFSLSLDT